MNLLYTNNEHSKEQILYLQAVEKKITAQATQELTLYKLVRDLREAQQA
jgi:hypothetical protein